MSEHGSYHITSVPTYIKVYVGLLILTVITVAVAQFDFGRMNTFIAMFVASIKAVLVVLWFMHQKYESSMNRLIFISGFFFLLLFFAFSAGDIFTRVNLINTFQ